MDRLQHVYRTVHEQGFLPIFTADAFNSQALVEACVEAGCKAIEYTLRRPDARTMIPWIRERYPNLCLLVGSTIDSDQLVRYARRRHPQLLTLAELDAMGVDGFVSMVGFGPETIERYSSSRLIVAPVSTMYEMFRALTAGAHFVKVAGTRLDLVSEFRRDATYDLCPIMVTGGITIDRISLSVQHGAVLAGTGFDLMLRGQPPGISASQVANTLTQYLEAMHNSRHEKWPLLADSRNWEFDKWLTALPHYHPFNVDSR